MSAPYILLFDVMSTLVYDPFWTDLPNTLQKDLKTWFVDKDRTAWLDFENGAISEELFFERFFGHVGHPEAFLMKDTFVQNYRYLEGIPTLLTQLCQSQIPCYVLSNYPIWFEELDQKLQLHQYMKHMFVSYQIGMRKPDTEIYQYVQKTLQIPAKNVIFVDDRLENCMGAHSVGMKYHHFQSVEGLQNMLYHYNILV